MAVDCEDPLRLVFYEEWADRAALDAHFAQAGSAGDYTLILEAPGYDPATHLGGVAYLFLRGMCGPDTPVVEGTTCGVFRWSPPPPLLVALSDLLAGRTP